MYYLYADVLLAEIDMGLESACVFNWDAHPVRFIFPYEPFQNKRYIDKFLLNFFLIKYVSYVKTVQCDKTQIRLIVKMEIIR